MNSIAQMNCQNIDILFCDIDDTLTTEGKLPANSYSKLWDLTQAGVKIIPITGRPAGWCDMIARFWPVTAVIGENGAFYFSYHQQKMTRVWAYGDEERLYFQQKLNVVREEILKTVPGSAISADQFCRLFDLAIDFCEDVPALSAADIEKIVAVFKKHGAQAKVSSIHVNGWFGAHDKLTMCETYCKDQLQIDIRRHQDRIAFIGDSPNDEPLFGFFKNSVGVANIQNFAKDLNTPPQFICSKDSGDGFAEFAELLLNSKT